RSVPGPEHRERLPRRGGSAPWPISSAGAPRAPGPLRATARGDPRWAARAEDLRGTGGAHDARPDRGARAHLVGFFVGLLAERCADRRRRRHFWAPARAG